MPYETESMGSNRVWKYVPVLAVILSLFLLVQTVNALRDTGRDTIPQNVITVSGEGEVFAAPDVATFTFSVMSEGANVKEAQDKVTPKINDILAALEAVGIEERDIKTVDFSANPKYEYRQIVCITTPCPPGRQEIVGYEVNQSILVKVRDVAKTAEAVDAATSKGATNVSGISFTVDDQDALLREARKIAIEDAKAKAEILSDDLDVRLVRIVSFSESGGPYPIYFKGEAAFGRGGADAVAPAPSLPTGENKITSNVTITYEIR